MKHGDREDVVHDFGEEWNRFDQSSLDEEEHLDLFERYFAIFPWDELPKNARGFDLGCGSGRWAQLVAPRVGQLHCIEPSDALNVAQRNLAIHENVRFHPNPVEQWPDEVCNMDFGYSLGVLHHISDTQRGLKSCVDALRPGAPFLLYLYYALDNRPLWYRQVWKASDSARAVISRLPNSLKHGVTDAIATLVYLPLARGARAAEQFGLNVSNFPLSSYRHLSFYTLRTDALDRFGTRLEKRYTKEDIRVMMESAGLTQIEFHAGEPYWCAVGRKSE